MSQTTPEKRQKLLYWFMAGDPKGGDYRGQMRVWIAWLYNVPESQIENIVDKYIETHATIDRAVEKTGGAGNKGLIHQLLYNQEFFNRLNKDGKEAFTEVTIDDVIHVLKQFCRRGTCSGCHEDIIDITKVRRGSGFACPKCGGAVKPAFSKIITITKAIQKHKNWFAENLKRMQDSILQRYL